MSTPPITIKIVVPAEAVKACLALEAEPWLPATYFLRTVAEKLDEKANEVDAKGSAAECRLDGSYELTIDYFLHFEEKK